MHNGHGLVALLLQILSHDAQVECDAALGEIIRGRGGRGHQIQHGILRVEVR